MNGEFNIDDIREILGNCPEYEEGHHLQRPFMSAYQIAIRFAERYPDHTLVGKLEVGGKETGRHTSLAQRIARFLSRALHDEKKKGDLNIEGGFLSHDLIKDLCFKNPDGEEIRVSTLSSQRGHAIFRLIP